MTTITTAKLREIAHTLGVSPEHLKCVIGVTWGVTIDDTPADETEHDMDKMTTTQEQLAAQIVAWADRRSISRKGSAAGAFYQEVALDIASGAHLAGPRVLSAVRVGNTIKVDIE